MKISPKAAAVRLRRGGVVALPTETVYGLAASIYHPQAYRAIFTLKGRPRTNPLIVHVASWAHACRLCGTSAPEWDAAREWTSRYWPGPLTLLLPIRQGALPAVVVGQQPYCALRCPQHPIFRQLVRQCGPLVAPSANRSGAPSPVTAAHVEQDYSGQVAVVDGDRAVLGLESTIIGPHEGHWAILRPGSCHLDLPYRDGSGVPGSRHAHYQPKTPLYWGVQADAPAILGFSNRHYPKGAQVLIFGASTQPEQVQYRLFSILRQLDTLGVAWGCIDTHFPREGRWLAIYDRLRRAAIAQK